MPDSTRFLASTSWAGYYLKTYLLVAGFIFIPGTMTGALFPSLLRFAGTLVSLPATAVGRLYSINVLGSILGSLIAGFLLIRTFGVGKSILLLSFLYLLTALYLLKAFNLAFKRRPVLLLATAFLLSCAAAFSLFGRPPGPAAGPARLLDTIEGSHATVTVVEEKGNIRMRINNSYTLGDTFDLTRQHFQAELPLFLHPDPRKIFFLGLGTGITAAAALTFPVDSVTVCELLPEVIEASRTYYAPYLNGLFSDPRVTVIAEDGRNYLQGTQERYDVIVSDLFLPWKAGTGNLYTVEHFKNVRKRLTNEGLYVQWLPLYQMSEEEFTIIANTFLQAFPQATLWLATFFPQRPTIALVGAGEGFALNPARLPANWRANRNNPATVEDSFIKSILLMYYAGNLSTLPDTWRHTPINTNDSSLIEFIAPLTEQKSQQDDSVWMKDDKGIDFLQRLWQQTPPAADPYLAHLNAQEKRYVEAGHQLYLSVHDRNKKLTEKAEAGLARFKQLADPSLVHLLFPDKEKAPPRK